MKLHDGTVLYMYLLDKFGWFKAILNTLTSLGARVIQKGKYGWK